MASTARNTFPFTVCEMRKTRNVDFLNVLRMEGTFYSNTNTLSAVREALWGGRRGHVSGRHSSDCEIEFLILSFNVEKWNERSGFLNLGLDLKYLKTNILAICSWWRRPGVLRTLHRVRRLNWSGFQIRRLENPEFDAPDSEDSVITLISALRFFLTLNRLNDTTHTGENWSWNPSTHMLVPLETSSRPTHRQFLSVLSRHPLVHEFQTQN